MDPTQITVSGPDFDVNQITKAVVNYDVSGLDDSIEEVLDVVFLNEEGNEVEFTSSATSVDFTQVTMKLPVYRTKELTLALELEEGGGIKEENVEISIVPETIRVKGSVQDIEALQDVFILDTLKLAELEDENEQEPLIYSLVLPEGVTIVSSETEAVATVRITGVERETVEISDIRLQNAPTDNVYETFTKTARVTIRGSSKEIREIKQSEDNGLYIVVDLTDYTDVSVYMIPGVVISEKYPGIGVMDSVVIGVVVSAPEPEPEPTNPTDEEG